MTQHRRTFLKHTATAAAAAWVLPLMDSFAASPAKRKILVRSGWQSVNIGDIGHTFGLLKILKERLPEVEIVLWNKSYDRGVEELLIQYFPEIPRIKCPPDQMNADLQKAFDECSFMIHSSGPFVTAQKDLKAWSDKTKKPYGIYGVSLDEVGADLLSLINKASFFYCRDTESLKYFKTLGSTCPVIGFAPDSTFGIRVYNEAKAQTYLDSVGLKKGEFICLIPRMRYTPYFQMVGREPSEEEKEKYAISMAYKKRDSVKTIAIIENWVKATGLKVLVCPEVTYQVEFGKETVYDLLSPELKPSVVWRDSFWGPDEATSVYKQCRMIVGIEPHSLIMAVAHGIPAIHVKQATDTRKGQMWRDIGLGDWYFLMDETPASQISHEMLNIHKNYAAAVAKTNAAMKSVVTIQADTMKVLGKLIK